jgi:hypothetical protein
VTLTTAYPVTVTEPDRQADHVTKRNPTAKRIGQTGKATITGRRPATRYDARRSLDRRTHSLHRPTRPEGDDCKAASVSWRDCLDAT